MNTFLSKTTHDSRTEIPLTIESVRSKDIESASSNVKISIVTVAFNSAATIRDTIESVLSQTYQNLEYIIVDGQSKDETVAIIKEYENQFGNRLQWISEPDKGLYDAMNKGIRMAKGDVVGILNSDDFYHRQDSIEKIANAFKDKKNKSVFADVRFVYPNNLNKTVRYYSSEKFSPRLFRFGFMPAHPTFFTYKKYFEKYGYYQTDYVMAADYELLVRFLYVHKLTYKYLPIDLLKMRRGGRSTASIREKLKFDFEIVRACRSNGIYTNTVILLFRGFEKIYEFFDTKERAPSKA
jgi:glycosyltransferase involved in cell wall biosynthesis